MQVKLSDYLEMGKDKTGKAMNEGIDSMVRGFKKHGSRILRSEEVQRAQKASGSLVDKIGDAATALGQFATGAFADKIRDAAAAVGDFAED